MPPSLPVDERAGRLLAAARQRRHVQLQLLKRLVDIDSQWSYPEGVAAVGEEMSERFTRLGFFVEEVDQPPLDEGLRWVAELLGPGHRPENLAPTLVASRDGVGDQRILVLGDCDTAFSPADATFRLDGDVARGVGVADMKGGLVVMLEALEVAAGGQMSCPPITIVLAGDEQAGSLGSRTTIRDQAASCHVALCLECARDGGNVMAARAHIGVGLVEAIGREAHAGTSRREGLSAIRALAGLLPSIDDLTTDDVLATVTIISGGRRRSVVPGLARAVVDLRAADTRHWESLVADIGDLVERTDSAATLTFRSHVHRPGVPWTATSDRLLSRLDEAANRIGVVVPGAVASLAAGSSAFAAEAGLPVLDGLGPSGGDLMTADEHILVSTIAERAAVLAALLDDLSTTPLEIAA